MIEGNNGSIPLEQMEMDSTAGVKPVQEESRVIVAEETLRTVGPPPTNGCCHTLRPQHCLVVLVAATVLHGSSGSLAYSIGTLFVDWTETFDSGKSATAWVISINLGLMFLTGPIAGALASTLGDRATAITGSLLAALGLAASSFCTNIVQLYVTVGMLAGVGFGLMQMTALSNVGRHFNKRRSLAMAAVSFGSGSCLFGFPYMHRTISDVCSWRGAHMVLAALVLHGVVMGALLRPPRQEATPTGSEIRGDWWRMFALCKDIRLVLFALGNMLMGFGGNTLPALIVDYAVDIGISKTDGAKLLSLIGLGGLLGRLVVLPLLMTRHIKGRAMHLYTLGGVLRAVGTVLCPTTSSMVTLSALNVAYGVGLGMQISTGTPSLSEVFGYGNLPYYIGFYFWSLGTGSILGAPASGWMYDTSHNYDLPLYVNGVITMVSIVFHAAVICIPAPGAVSKSATTDHACPPEMGDVAIIYTSTLAESTRL